ncbi:MULTISPECIES: hypothetical protein [Streptomyces albovinaceus subgroup]|nr:hypothetical protein [Streptomyces mediolani]WSF77434.1 hypothetical protein OG838_15285 [Streptomyces globisporus]WSU81877.1 hypothetical protein OG215_15115 [Streptomyces globisporus]
MNRRAAVEAPAASAKRQLLDAVDDAHWTPRRHSSCCTGPP